MEFWEEKTMEEVIDNLYNGQTPSRANKRYWNGEINWLSSGELNKGIVTKTIEKITEKGRKNANLKIVPKGTFIIAITGLEAAGTRGNCAVLGIDTTLNQSCMAIYPNKELLDSLFLLQWYMKNGEEYGLKYTQGTKQQSYNATLIHKLKINMPVRVEQQKIGEFFKHLDQMTSLEQRKLEKTKALKSAYLAEMFPAEGELVPKRRFSGFTGEWTYKKLSEIVDKSVDNRGKTPPLNADGDYHLIEVASLGNRFPDYSKVSKFLDQNSYENSLRGYLSKGDILFSTVGRIGVVSLADDNEFAVIAQNIVGFRANKNFYSDYLYAVFTTVDNREKANKIVMGAVQPSIKVSQLVDVKYLITTNIQEQQLIGDFFKKLDESITNHQQKLNKLKAMKQAYLEEMFV